MSDRPHVRGQVAQSLISFAVVVSCTGVFSEAAGQDFKDDRVIVKLRSGLAATAESLPEHVLPSGLPELDRVCAKYGIRDGRRLIREHGRPIGDPELFRQIGLDRIYLLFLAEPGELEVLRLVRELKAMPWVEYAEPSFFFELQETIPDDERFSLQWHHQNTGQTGGTPGADIESPAAWDFGTGSPSTIVAVIDSGVDQDHPDLVDNLLLPGYDLTNSPEGVEDTWDHGTSVAGNVAARGSNGIGVTGVCWTCRVLPMKIFGSTVASLEEIADGVRIVADDGADVINMSFGGGGGWSEAFIDALDYAQGLGALPIGGSGNGGNYSPFPPAMYPNVVSCAGTRHDDVRYGSYGDHAEIAAPTDFMTTRNNDSYATFRGTSGAAPVASGVAALLRDVDPTLHVQELRQLLRLGAEDQIGDPSEDTPGWDQYLGYGRINANNAMLLIDGPWLALDRPHTLCGGTLHVDLKDKSAGATVDVTLAGSIGGDLETVSVTPVTAHGYYRGSIPLSWAGVDGPVVNGDGKLDLAHEETVTASVGGLSATAFADCLQRLCVEDLPGLPASGDCDADGVLDPGELWTIEAQLRNAQTLELPTAVVTLGSTSASVEMIQETQLLGDYNPLELDDIFPFRLRVMPGSPAAESIPFEFAIDGAGWTAAVTECTDQGAPPSFTLTGNADGGGPDSWPAFPPSGLTGSTDDCPTSFSLTWDAVAGAVGYNVYRSEISCLDAELLTTPYGSTAGTGFVDDAVDNVEYFYAVEGLEPLTSCSTNRSCISGGCFCALPGDPTSLRVGRAAGDLLLSWDDPGPTGDSWNIYRDTAPDRSTWGAPHDSGVTDSDPGTPGIQYVDTGAAQAGSPLFYLVTSVNGCGESEL